MINFLIKLRLLVMFRLLVPVIFVILASTILSYYLLPKKLLSYYCEKYDIFYKIVNFEKKKEIILTIDDVPYYYTSFSNILSTLDKYEIKASFFVISQYINEENKPLLIKAIKNGHHLANHGSKNRMHARLGYEGLKQEIEVCENKLKELYQEAGVEYPQISFYRPGCGYISNNILLLRDDIKFVITLGTTYPHDPQVPIPKINELYIRCKIENGDIIILHDRSWTYPLLQNIIPYLLDKGYKFETLNKKLK